MTGKDSSFAPEYKPLLWKYDEPQEQQDSHVVFYKANYVYRPEGRITSRRINMYWINRFWRLKRLYREMQMNGEV